MDELVATEKVLLALIDGACAHACVSNRFAVAHTWMLCRPVLCSGKPIVSEAYIQRLCDAKQNNGVLPPAAECVLLLFLLFPLHPSEPVFVVCWRRRSFSPRAAAHLPELGKHLKIDRSARKTMFTGKTFLFLSEKQVMCAIDAAPRHCLPPFHLSLSALQWKDTSMIISRAGGQSQLLRAKVRFAVCLPLLVHC
jgi:hypothetical protein